MHSKGNHKQNEKTTYRMGENDATNNRLISKIYKQRVEPNIQETKQPDQKMGRGSKQMFLQGRHTEGQEAHEKTFNIVFRELQIKTTMRYHLIPSQKGHHQKIYKQDLPGGSLMNLPMQETWLQALIREDPICCGAAKPVCPKY